jgi:hypothetical protein
MELEEFVAEALVAIQKGVKAAIDLAESGGTIGRINPIWSDNIDWPKHVQLVEFDIAVTAGEKSSAGGKGGVKVFSFEIAADGSKGVERSTVSRVKFSIPIVPPAQVTHRS